MALKSFYERFILRGKPKKVSLTALEDKILRIAFALLRKGGRFEERKWSFPGNTL